MRSLPGRSIDETTSPALVLREVVSDAHRALESHAHQQVLLSDRVARDFVASYVASLIPVHRALESRLECCEDPRVESMFRSHHRRAASMEADLDSLDWKPGAATLPDCVTDFVRSFEACSAARTVGRWYVFEGATNGGRFLAERIGRALDPDEPPRLVSFDPYGSEQAEHWRAFRAGLDAFTADLDDCIVGAQETFAFHATLFDARMAEEAR